MITVYLNSLIKKQDLSEKRAEKLLEMLLSGQATPVQISAILSALASKGETVEEITGFIKGMRKRMLAIKTPSGTIDIVGTGGDGSNSFNISTVSAIVAASCGVTVAKHGNRAASSLCGSADVLEELGVNINLSPEKAGQILEKNGMVFLFAPNFHPAMKVAGPVRKELKVRTIFNYLGPFLNPGRVKRMILGVADKKIAAKFASIAAKLNFEHLIIVTGEEGLDEISISGKTAVLEIKKGATRRFIIDPVKLGFPEYSKEELTGGAPRINASIAIDILSGRETGAKRDAVLLNSAYALLVAGKVKSVKQGLMLAEDAVNSGKSRQLLEIMIKETNL
jgi:anthranilate phosphoribosyltransferase